MKTIELIVEEEPWTPREMPPRADGRVLIRIALSEVTLRQQIKQAG